MLRHQLLADFPADATNDLQGLSFCPLNDNSSALATRPSLRGQTSVLCGVVAPCYQRGVTTSYNKCLNP